MQSTTWFLVGDASRARLFRSIERTRAPVLVKEFDHVKGREHDHDLVTDRQGRSQDSAGGTHSVSLSGGQSPKEHEGVVFAKELAVYLSQGLKSHEYQRLVLVAAPHFLGLLRGALTPEVTKHVISSVDKDLTTLTLHEVISRLEQLQ
jgi:protein required for attachment to host cells